MKRRLVIGLLLAGSLGAFLMGQRSEQPGDPPREIPEPPDAPRPDLVVSPEGLEAFVPYRGRRFSVPFTFDYPRNWVAGEEEGRSEPYQQIVILGPRNAQDTYSAGLTIRILPTRAAGGSYADLSELAQWRRSQHAQTKDAVILKEQMAHVGGLSGTELEVESHAALPPRALEQHRTTLRTHLVMLAKGDRLYEFSYSADAHDYPRYHSAFDRLLRSLRFTP